METLFVFSGQTIEGFPYIIYSKIFEDKINTHGTIFIQGKFVDLLFVEESIEREKEKGKNNDLAVLIQYSSKSIFKTICTDRC